VVSIALPNLAVVALIVPVTISVCNILSLDPVPYVIMETIMSTMGSTMTTITNPPNIIIANGLEEDGVDVISFITNVGLGVVITIPFLVVGMCFMFPDIYRAKRVHMDVAALLSKYSIKDHRMMNQTGAILASAIGLMFLSPVHGLDPSWFAFGGALTSLTLSSSGDIFKRCRIKVPHHLIPLIFIPNTLPPSHGPLNPTCQTRLILYYA
jgi:Na+/H+ antiporter NhaD/arsenite permease-like protein